MPVAALHSLLHLVLRGAHTGLDVLLQAGAVADHDGGTVIGLSLTQSLQSLGLVSAHGHLGDVHIAVLHQHGTQILLGYPLAAGGKLGGSGGGGGLGGLTAGVGIHLGIQHHQVHVTVLGHHMIDAAVADIVGPAVTAHSPHGLLSQIFLVLQDVLHVLGLLCLFQSGDQSVRDGTGGLRLLPAVLIGLHSLHGDTGGLDGLQTDQQLFADGVLCVEEAVGKLSVVLKQRVLPSGAVTLTVLAVGQDGGAAGDGGGAAGSVADVHPIAEQLAQQLDIGSLSAASAGGGELEVGLCELDVLHALVIDNVLLQVAFVHGHLVEEGLLGLHVLEGGHGESTLGGAGGQAHAAAQAVIGRDLHPEGIGGILAQTLGGDSLEPGGNGLLLLLGQQHGADSGMGAAHGAAVALDALAAVPLGDLGGDTALGEHGGSVFPSAVQNAVLLEHGNGELIALLTVHGHDDIPDEGSEALGLRDGSVLRIGPGGGDLHLHSGADAQIHGLIVQVHDLLTGLLEVGVVVVLLHILNGQIHGDDLGQGEEGALEDVIGTLAQADLLCQLGSVDDVEVGVLPGQIALHLGRQVRVQLLHRPRAVQQEGAALLQILGGVILFDVGGSMDRHEVSRGHQIGAADGLVAEAQVALGQAAGLHGIIGEVSLSVLAAHEADGGDGVLVGAHGAVAAQTPQLAADLAGMGQLNLLVVQRGIGHIIIDADGEVVLGSLLLQVVVHSNDLAGGGVLGGEAVPAAHHADIAAASLIQSGDNIQIHRLAHGAGLLVAVQHGDPLAGGGDGGGKVLHREGTEQVDLHHAHLAALSVQVVHGLLHGLAGGAHHHDDFLRIGRAVVVEQLVITAGELVDLVHVVLDGVGQGIGLDVGAFLALEVDVGVHVVAPVGGMLRVQGLMAEGLQGLLIHQTTEILIVQSLDPLHLVRGAEAVEAVHEGIPAADGGQMSHGGQIHCLLRAGGHQHGVAGHTAGHEVCMVTEDRVMVGGHHAGRNVHDAGQELAAHGVHGGDHQHQALRGGEGGGQGACLQGTVAGAGSAGLRLHLDHVHRGAEQVLLALGGPLVHLFRHGGGRGDGVDGRHLGKGVRTVRGCRVAVHDYVIFLHT